MNIDFTDKGFRFCTIPSGLVEVLWPQIIVHLEKTIGLGCGDISEESIKTKATQGLTTLFIVTKGEDIVAVSTIEIATYESGLRALLIPIVGGSGIHDWGETWIKIIQALAKDLGCSELRGFAARDGWMRLLKTRGWKENHTVITLQLEQV